MHTLLLEMPSECPGIVPHGSYAFAGFENTARENLHYSAGRAGEPLATHLPDCLIGFIALLSRWLICLPVSMTTH